MNPRLQNLSSVGWIYRGWTVKWNQDNILWWLWS